MFNHTSALDAFVVAGVIDRQLRRWCRPLVKVELFDAPVIGAIVRSAGAIPVERSADANRDTAYAAAIEQLRAGQTVMIAPEATVTHDGSLLPLRHGAARLALEADVDILVATQFGAQRGLSPVVKLPQRGASVTMAFDVIQPWAQEDASSLTGRIAATMIDRMAQLRDEYPQPEPEAPWWPPYHTPASPTAVARDSLKRYRTSMAEAIEQARERMGQVAERSLDARMDQAKQKATEVAEGARKRTHALNEQARERTHAFSEQAREKSEALAEQARERVDEFTTEARKRAAALGQRRSDTHHDTADGVSDNDAGDAPPDETNC